MKKLIKRVLRAGMPVPGVMKPVIRGLYQAGVVVVEGSAFIRKFFWIEPVLRSVCQSVGKGLRAECLPYMRGKGRLMLGENVYLSGRSCFYFMSGMPKTPEIIIGCGTFIGSGCTFSSARQIRVGEKCLISAGVRVHDNDGHPLDPGRRNRNEPITQDEAVEVIIGNNVWIGAGAIILKGVTIGDDAVVGAMAVVTGDVPARAVLAGNPARVVKHMGRGDSL
jgi:acetyltransferase-like isoleucine patch superfamily enzyme